MERTIQPGAKKEGRDPWLLSSPEDTQYTTHCSRAHRIYTHHGVTSDVCRESLVSIGRREGSEDLHGTIRCDRNLMVA